MKKRRIALNYIAILFVLISTFIACDKDFASIDSDIINSDNASHFNADALRFNVLTYNKKLDPVQTNNLPVNLLGVYSDPLYGMTTANMVTQISTNIFNREFGENVVLDSVVLIIPYFSRAVNTTEDGETIYELDSVFGTEPVKLSIYENNYFLRDFDPGSSVNTPQRYYSDGSTGLDQISSAQLEGTLIFEMNEFFPSEKEIKLVDTADVVTDRLAPALRLKLDPNFWVQKIINKEGDLVLSNLNNFENYFRGLYFKVEPIDNKGHLTLLNFASSNANITMYYSIDSATTAGTREGRTYEFSFSGNRVNFLSEPSLAIPPADETNGDPKLYLKGGQGSIAVVDLFNGLIEDPDSGLMVPQLDYFKSKKGKWLINEANLVFYVDQGTVQGIKEPERVYLYDLNNKTPLTDFYIDIDNTVTPVNSRIGHLGRLQHTDNDPSLPGVRYKIRLTEHINNILLRDSTNVKLGLAVSANVNLESSSLQYNVLTNDGLVDRTPLSSILTPRGTVLFGNNAALEEKKVSLEIFYTEPKN